MPLSTEQQVRTPLGRYPLGGRREVCLRAEFTSSTVSLVWISVSAQKINDTNTSRPLVDNTRSTTWVDPREHRAQATQGSSTHHRARVKPRSPQDGRCASPRPRASISSIATPKQQYGTIRACPRSMPTSQAQFSPQGVGLPLSTSHVRSH